MLIKGLSVEGVGRFRSLARVDGFAGGVNVLAAGNEAGKSTLFRAIRTCVFSRHDSREKDIVALGSDEGQLPASVELTFEQNEKTYVIKKRFLRSPNASLTENGREIARGKQADEAVWELLGVSPATGRGKVDDGAFGVLWVGQRSSFEKPEPGAAASSALHSVIESEVGALIGGERARRVLEETKRDVSDYLTDSGKEKSGGALHAARQEVEHWRAAESEANAKLNQLEQHFGLLAQLRQKQKETSDPAEAARLTADLGDARNSLTEARESARELLRMEGEAANRAGALERATQSLDGFHDLTTRIDANRSREAALAAELPELVARETEARAALLRTLEQIDDIDKAAHLVSSQEMAVEKLASALTLSKRKDDLQRQLAALETSAASLLQIDAQIARITIEPRHVGDLDDLERQIAVADAQVSAAASRLTIEVLPAGSGRVNVDGATLQDDHSAPVVAPTKVMIGDWAVVTVTPAANANHDKRKALDGKRMALLKTIGVPSSADARALLSKRRDLESVRQGIFAQLKALRGTKDVAPVIAEVRAEIADIDATIAAAMAAADCAELPTAAEIEAGRISLSQQRAPLEAQRASLREKHKQQQEAQATAAAARGAFESNLENLRKTIADGLALCPDTERLARQAALLATVTAADTSHRTAAALLLARRQTAPDATQLERLEVRSQRLQQALDNRNNELVRLEGEIGRLAGQIQTAGGLGVGEALAAAREKLAIAERELSRIENRVATSQLLRDTITNCLSEGRERYFEPVKKHLRPFLDDLFPGAELELGDRFDVTQIKRERSEDFARLSDGTQEQIAVLVRLAMGSMLAEQGRSVPIILDDALVYSDDDRIQRMFDALSRAGKRQQIIVLTCRLRAFQALGGNVLRVESAVRRDVPALT